MRKLILALGLTLSFTGMARGQRCKVCFSVVWKDQLNNVREGLSAGDLKWFQKKMAKKYPDVCYSEPSSSIPLVFSISVAAATRVIDGTEQSRPIFYLSLESRDGDKLAVLHNFSEQDCPVCNPGHDVIEDALKWIHSGSMTDKKQGVVVPQSP